MAGVGSTPGNGTYYMSFWCLRLITAPEPIIVFGCCAENQTGVSTVLRAVPLQTEWFSCPSLLLISLVGANGARGTRRSPSRSHAKTTWIRWTSRPSSAASYRSRKIIRAAAIMRDYRRMGSQSQRGNGGHVANVAQDVGELLSRLWGAAIDAAVFFVRREGHEDGTHKILLARIFRVLDALVWRQLNNPYYRNVQ